LQTTCQLIVGDYGFTVRVAHGAIEVLRGEAIHPEAILETDVEVLSRLLDGSESLTAATRARRARVTGDAAPIERLLDAVKLPQARSPSATDG
jgi:hypothetical protein